MRYWVVVFGCVLSCARAHPADHAASGDEMPTAPTESASRMVPEPSGPAACHLPAEALAALSPSSQHVFSEVQADWVSRSDAYERDTGKLVEAQSGAPERPQFLETRYYEPGSLGARGELPDMQLFQARLPTDEAGLRKIRRTLTSGVVVLESDVANGEIFECSFYDDGQFASYRHYREGLIAGFSVDPARHETSHFNDGRGVLTTWQSARAFETIWLLDGRGYLEKHVSEDNSVSFLALLPRDSLRWSAEGEELSLGARGELWRKSPGQPATAELLGFPNTLPAMPADSTHLLIVEEDQVEFRPPNEQQLRARAAAISAAYPTRRAEFFATFDEVLARAGVTLDSIGLASLRSPH
ncbi:MAG: hypothetical protein U0271_00700 [Polyangiaceae bacterium]